MKLMHVLLAILFSAGVVVSIPGSYFPYFFRFLRGLFALFSKKKKKSLKITGFETFSKGYSSAFIVSHQPVAESISVVTNGN